MQNCQVLIEKLLQAKQDIYLLEKELKKLKTFDLVHFIEKSYFDKDGAQNCLVFKPILEYFTLNSNSITKWKSKGLFNGSLEVVSTSDNTLTPSVSYYRDRVKLRFTGSFATNNSDIHSLKSCKPLCDFQNNQLSYTGKCIIWSC